jgi:hypothetical protein
MMLVPPISSSISFSRFRKRAKDWQSAQASIYITITVECALEFAKTATNRVSHSFAPLLEELAIM